MLCSDVVLLQLTMCGFESGRCQLLQEARSEPGKDWTTRLIICAIHPSAAGLCASQTEVGNKKFTSHSMMKRLRVRKALPCYAVHLFWVSARGTSRLCYQTGDGTQAPSRRCTCQRDPFVSMLVQALYIEEELHCLPRPAAFDPLGKFSENMK